MKFRHNGLSFVKKRWWIQQPTIGLLNIGEEEVKGNDVIKATAELLADSDLNYCGFVEGDDIFKGSVDVIVCDGFVGNVALKAERGPQITIRHSERGV